VIKIRFFASLRERLDISSIDIEYAGQHDVQQVMDSLINTHEKWHALAEQDVLVAINQTLSGKDCAVNDGDEIAFFPPVTGG